MVQIRNIHYQEYLRNPLNKKILKINIKNINNACIDSNLLLDIKNEKNVIIGPSNPITSIGPIL